jgi:signal-transduction protein with cAMP-binding, CBS, and nucleotidyltransferase domain
MSIEKMLKGNVLFGSLSVDEVDRISTFSSVKEFRKDETIFTFNQASSHFYMMMDGSVYLQLPANPPEFSFAISKIQKGELFGLSPLLDSRRYTSTARCYAATRVLSIEAKPFREILRSNYPAGFTIMNQVARIYFGRYIDVLKRFQDVVGQISLVR